MYEQLLAKAAQVLARANWISLEPADLASTIYLRMFHPLERKRRGLIDRVRSAASPDAYVMQVVRNAAFDETRRQQRWKPLGHVDAAGHVESRDEPLEWEEYEDASGDLFAALERLSPVQRNAVLGRLAGHTISQIAEHEGRSYGTVAADISRGLSRLREILSGSEVAVTKALAMRLRDRVEKSAKTD